MAVTRTVAKGSTRNYPPLILAALMMLVLLAVLPSALNLPQTNPSQTLEYAPVPPEDENVTPPAGNFSALGLPGGSSIGSDAAAAEELPPAVDQNGRPLKAPSTKRCVGDPPRQTEDPLSPPCSAFFDGDNGGTTYAGVTSNEIRVLFYFDGAPGQTPSSRGQEPRAVEKYVDLAEPPAEDEQVNARMLRLYQQYFNDRYQTYGRWVHFYVYFDRSDITTAEARRADAAENFARIKPFAVFNQSFLGFSEEYNRVMTRKRVLAFTGAQNSRNQCCSPQSDYLATPGLRWSLAATTEQYWPQISDVICKQIVGRPVSYGGEPADQGRPRVLGLIVNKVADRLERDRLARGIEADVKACGGSFATEWVNDTFCESADKAAAAVADFQAHGVTTVIWPSGPDPATDECAGLHFTNAAASAGYFPEVFMSGEGGSDTTFNGQVVNQEFLRHTIALTPYTRAEELGARPCVQAAREIDPGAPRIDVETYGCELYDGVRLIFTGIQVAGPKLTPKSMDTGFHAIPPGDSPDPKVGACFFADAHDYSCAKDSMLVHWDPAGKDPGASGSGCWRMIEGGKRYRAGRWPARDIAAIRRPDDPCNRQGFTV